MATSNHKSVADSWENLVWFINERHRIFVKRRAEFPSPWTTDKILQEAKFCNVYRQDDKVTRFEIEWLKQNFGFEKQLRGILLLRHCNSIPAFQWLMGDVDQPPDKDMIGDAMICWKENFADKGHEFTKKEYIERWVEFVDGKNRLDDLCDRLRYLRDGKVAYYLIRDFRDCMHKTKLPEPYNHYNQFWAYEVYTSLTYTKWFAPTENDFVFVGPGASPALLKLYGNPARYDQVRYLVDVHKFLKENLKLEDARPWTLRNTEHCLCEWRKYFQIKEHSKPIRRSYSPPAWAR